MTWGDEERGPAVGRASLLAVNAPLTQKFALFRAFGRKDVKNIA